MINNKTGHHAGSVMARFLLQLNTMLMGDPVLPYKKTSGPYGVLLVYLTGWLKTFPACNRCQTENSIYLKN